MSLKKGIYKNNFKYLKKFQFIYFFVINILEYDNEKY